jgi:hypothetical protein
VGPVGYPDRRDGRTAEADQKPSGQAGGAAQSESSEPVPGPAAERVTPPEPSAAAISAGQDPPTGPARPAAASGEQAGGDITDAVAVVRPDSAAEQADSPGATAQAGESGTPAADGDGTGGSKAADGQDKGDGTTATEDPAKRPGVLTRGRSGAARVGGRVARLAPPGARRAIRRAIPRRGPREPGASAPDVAGVALARLTTLPVLLIVAWLLPGLPLLLAGDFVPVPMLLISAPLLVALVANGLRVVPGRWPRLIPGKARDRDWTSWFGLMATVAVAAGFAAWQLVEHSESVVVLRDQGAYLQTAYWLAQHGSLPISQSLQAFGGAHPGLDFSSIGFFAHGTSVIPSFTSGLPMLLAGGFWAQGTSGAAAMGPVLGGLAILSFGGLTARLAGPQWAPAGAIVLGLTLPEQYTARSSFAETALQVLLFGGLCLLIDAFTVRVTPRRVAPGRLAPAASWRRLRDPRAWRRAVSAQAWSDRLTPPAVLAGFGGLALGLGVLVSLDSLVMLLPVIPFAGLLLVARRPGATSFCIGVVVGAGYGLADGYLLSRPFLDSVSHPIEVVGLVAVWLAALTIVVVQLMRVPRVRRRLRRLAAGWPSRWLPAAASVLAVAALIGFAIRPYAETVHGTPGAAVAHFVGGLQRAQGLLVDPTRTYAEDTLYWVIWYIGLPAVLLAAFGVAQLTRRCLQALLTWKDPAGAWRNWALPLAIICAGTVATLWDPGIVPDQPFASRRLVVAVLPGLILCAIWAAVWLTGHARERGAKRVTASIAGLFCVAALIVPTAATTFGAGLTHSGRSGGLKPTAQGMAGRRVSAGELTAVGELCGSLRGGASVVIVDRLVAQRFTQVIRGMCGVPTAWMVGQPQADVDTVLNAISAAGRHPVLLGATPGELVPFGGSPEKVLDLRTTTDAHDLTSPPTTPATIHFVIWMLVSQSGAGTA